MDRFDDGAREERRSAGRERDEQRAEEDFDQGKAGDLRGARAAAERHRRSLDVIERDSARDRRRHRGD